MIISGRITIYSVEVVNVLFNSSKLIEYCKEHIAEFKICTNCSLLGCSAKNSGKSLRMNYVTRILIFKYNQTNKYDILNSIRITLF